MIAVNATHIYFILQWIVPDVVLITTPGHLMRVPLAGGKAERIASLPTGSIHMTQGLALTSTQAIFIQAPKNGAGHSTISTVALDGGDVTVLATASGIANAVVVDDDNAYFCDAEGVKAVALKGGASRTLASGIVPFSLAVVDETLYFSSADSVYSVPTDGGEPVTVSAASGGRSLIACGAGICWLGGPALMGTLMQSLPPNLPVALTSGLRQAHDVVFDGEAYFVAGGFGVISRVPADGGSASVVYSESLLTHVALEGECLYWSSETTISSVALTAAHMLVAD